MSGREEKGVRAYMAGVQAGNNSTLNATKVWLEEVARRFADAGDKDAAELCQKLALVPAEALKTNEANAAQPGGPNLPVNLTFNNRPGQLPDN